MSENKIQKFSYSKLSLLEECPYKYKKYYIDKVEREFSSKIALGITFSDISEYVYKNLVPSESFSDSLIKELIEKFWIPVQYKEKYDNSPTFKFLKYNTPKEEQSAKDMLCFYLKRYFVDFPIQIKPFGVEVPFEVPYKDILLVGKIDFIRKNSNYFTIIDNKLGRTEYVLPTSLQLGIYIFAIEHLLPRFKIEKLGFYYVTKGLLQTINRTAFNLNLIFKNIDKYINIVKEGCFEKQENKFCKWCQFKEECKNSEHT